MTGRGKAGMTVRILTLGCAKNSVDGEVMSGLLVEDGHRVGLAVKIAGWALGAVVSWIVFYG